MGVNGEALQLHAVYTKPYFYYESRENPYQYKSHVLHPNMNKIEGSYDKIITIVPSYIPGKNITCLLPSVSLATIQTATNS